jgi:nucleoside-diphosphate-sugar epimerase
MKKLMITGGGGYVGSVLVPTLLKHGYQIIVVDNFWFGNYLQDSNNLTILKKDVRSLDENDLRGIETCIHLANIANDPAVDLDQTLSWEINVLATQQLIDKLERIGDLKQFIFASSGSVYGVKSEDKVTEELSLVPISAYNKTKMVAERVLLSYSDRIKIHNIRPATVCGYSPRMRLDVSVNLLTWHALTRKKITVFGGGQTRPNIHILDMVAVYSHFLENPEIPSGNYNAGFENISILDIAKKVQAYLTCDIEVEKSSDPRSYRQNSEKLLKTGFKPKYSVDDAIKQIIDVYKTGNLIENEDFFTVKKMKSLGF